jgi:hypothetical protein
MYVPCSHDPALTAFAVRFLDVVKPFMPFLPEVAQPEKKVRTASFLAGLQALIHCARSHSGKRSSTQP